MKRIALVPFATAVLYGCGNPTNEKQTGETIADTTQKVVAGNANLYIKDRSLYDPHFIEGFSNYNEPVKLIDNYLIAGADTTTFPADLPLNQKLVFKGAKGRKAYVLALTRTGLTTVAYDLQITCTDGQTISPMSGTAVLSWSFFMGTESDADEESTEGYGSSEYWDTRDSCSFSIRVGIGLDDKGRHRAKVMNTCKENDPQNIGIDECPVLRAE